VKSYAFPPIAKNRDGWGTQFYLLWNWMGIQLYLLWRWRDRCKAKAAALGATVAATAIGAVGRIGPFADGAGVYVDELTLWIVAHAASAERKRGVTQLDCWNAWNPNIECIAFDVL
jgi:hypothetical protein